MFQNSLLILLIFIIKINSQKTCQQCATLNLKENWVATGFPLIPDGFVFTDLCSKISATQSKNETINSKSCVSSCFEMLIPIENKYEIVRGCHEFFVWPEFAIKSNSSDWVCESNEIPNYGQVQLFTGEQSSTVFAALAFCAPNEANSTHCNNEFGELTIGKDPINNCQPGTTQQCKSCSEYDGNGECSKTSTSTCQGAYCTKTVGTINGHHYEARGCSGINPYQQNVCSWTEKYINLTTTAETARIAKKTKRSISLNYQTNQCFCKGDLCNSSPTSFMILPIIISIINFFTS